MDSLVKFITEEDQVNNFSHYMAEVNRARSVRDLAQIAKVVIGEQQKPNGNYFFPKGKSKEFWFHYKETKSRLLLEQEVKDSVLPEQNIA